MSGLCRLVRIPAVLLDLKHRALAPLLERLAFSSLLTRAVRRAGLAVMERDGHQRSRIVRRLCLAGSTTV